MEDVEERIAEALEVGKYVPARKLAADAGCTDSELEAFLSSLKKRGYEIEVNPTLGVRLLSEPDVLSEREIAMELKTSFIGRAIHCYSTIGSTNDLAKRLGEDGAEEGTVVIADEQRRGRGRFGRSWLSPKGEGIWMSVILRPQAGLEPVTALSLVAAYSVATSVRELTGMRATIKWPNDVRVGEKKMCGILAELDRDSAGGEFIVLGIGVNVNQVEFGEDLAQAATSIRIETGRIASRLPLIRRILENLEKFYVRARRDGFSSVIEKLREISTLVGKRVEVSMGEETVSGYVQDIDDRGRLIVRTDDGRIREILAGEADAVR
ncbi:MAG: biotin--[acetyl-CoA-carboxylase] ligase [bacterium]